MRSCGNFDLISQKLTRYWLLCLLTFLILYPVQALAQTKTIFGYTGADQTFTVPAGVYWLQVKAWGAGGGGSRYTGIYSTGGAGGYVSGTISVTPGDILKVVVGRGGRSDGATATTNYGFGGSTTYLPEYGSDGGGLTGIFTGSATVTDTSQARALMIAGGGGSGERDPYHVSSGGQGGDPTFGGGTTTMRGGFSPYLGGGGGGGYNGGRAGQLRLSSSSYIYQGEGGTNYLSASVAIPVSLSTPDIGSLPYPFNIITVNYPPNTADSDYVAGIGVGTSITFSKGGDGRVVIISGGPPLYVSKAVTAVSAGQGANANFSDAGDTVTFRYVVQNNSASALTNVRPVDAGPSFNGVAGENIGTPLSFIHQPADPSNTPGVTPASVAPGQAVVFTASYQMTVADVHRGASVPSGITGSATASSDQASVSNTAVATGSILAMPALAVVKSHIASNGTPVGRGDLITYTYAIKNEGNVVLRNISLSDVHQGTTLISGGTDNTVAPTNETILTGTRSTDATSGTNGRWDELWPGEEIALNYVYTVKQADLDNQ